MIQTATGEDVTTVVTHLRAFNASVVGAYAFKPVSLVYRDEDGGVVGGIVGEVVLGWLRIEMLWVAPGRRKMGVGSALLIAAEQAALELGAGHVHLDTFDWQAAGFYAKHGYLEFGRLNNYPQGHQRIFMSKTLCGYPTSTR